MTTVTLGKKEYKIEQLPIKQSREVRHKFSDFLSPAIDALNNAPQTNLTDYSALTGIITIAKDVLIEYSDTALDLVCEYAPNIAADRERIEETATDEEALNAFSEVIKLLFPFGKQLKALTGLNLPQTPKS